LEAYLPVPTMMREWKVFLPSVQVSFMISLPRRR
jgi:hypothetical protein